MIEMGPTAAVTIAPWRPLVKERISFLSILPVQVRSIEHHHESSAMTPRQAR
jgi:hypothetical protein